MAFAFNPITGKLDLVGSGGGSATTDASLLTSGTLADARLSSNVSLDNLNNNFTVGQTITAPANTSALTASYSVTGANTTPLLDLSGTWNTTGVARGILLNVTDTASAAASQLLNLQTGSTTRFQVRKDGLTYATHWFTTTTGFRVSNSTDGSGQSMQLNATGLALAAAATVNWTLGTVAASGSPDLVLARDAANILAQRNGTAAQAFRLYNQFVDSANFERAFMRWNSNLLEIGNEAGGTGNANRSINLLAGGNVELTCGGVFAASFRAGRSIITTSLNFAATSLASDPTTGDLASGRAGVYKNTTSGAVRLWYNDGGTLRSVQLA
jgi:hypothetical protein